MVLVTIQSVFCQQIELDNAKGRHRLVLLATSLANLSAELPMYLTNHPDIIELIKTFHEAVNGLLNAEGEILFEEDFLKEINTFSLFRTQ